MEITGKIVDILPLQSGEGKNGTWKKQEFILETPGQYPKKVCISIWGDKIDQFNLNTGETVNVSIDVESREFKGRWYTDVRAWKVEQPVAGGQPGPETDIIPPEPEPSGDPDDLPF